MKDPAKKKMLLSSLPLLLLNFIQKCDGCKEDLVTSSKIGATSQTSLRRMHNIIVWDAKDSNLDQSLGIEFDNLTSVTEIQVKSGKDSVSYVSEFAIQYSADDKGLYYKDYLDDQGLVKVFIVNHRGFNFELPHAITTKVLTIKEIRLLIAIYSFASTIMNFYSRGCELSLRDGTTGSRCILQFEAAIMTRKPSASTEVPSKLRMRPTSCTRTRSTSS